MWSKVCCVLAIVRLLCGLGCHVVWDVMCDWLIHMTGVCKYGSLLHMCLHEGSKFFHWVMKLIVYDNLIAFLARLWDINMSAYS